MRQVFTRTAVALLVLFALLTLWPAFGPVLTGGTRGEHLREQKHYAALFRAGDTNAPLLAMDWFSHGVHYCRINQSGNGFSALDVGYAKEGGNRISLDGTNRLLLVQAINQLPLQVKHFLPSERQIVISGIRSNQWFQCVYDREDVPIAVEKLYEMTGAYLEWFMPEVEGHQIIHSKYGNYHTSQAVVASFCAARSAPIAVSSGVNGVQIWDLSRSTVKPLSLQSKSHIGLGDCLAVAAISPDGNIVAIASIYDVLAVDWKTKKILWEGIPLAQSGKVSILNQQIAIGGDNGQFLFIAGAGRVERWNLATGKKLGVLATNQPTIKFLMTSRDGKVLLAGFDNRPFGDAMSVLFTIWNVGNDEPAAHITEPNGAGVGISSDGRRISLSVFGQRYLKIWNWQNGTVMEAPLRTPYASFQAYEMHWSPDNSKVAAYINTYPESIVIYNALNWKPLAQWKCGQVMSEARFDFEKNGEFLELRDHDITGLNLASLKIR